MSADLARETLVEVLSATLLGLGYNDVDITDTTMLVADLQLSSVDIVHVRIGPPVDLSEFADEPLDHDVLEAATDKILDALTAAPSRP